jgi:hypothetical protein
MTSTAVALLFSDLGVTKKAGLYHHELMGHELMGRDYPVSRSSPFRTFIEGKKRLDVPLSFEVLRTAEKKSAGKQLDLLDDSGIEPVRTQATA